MCTDFNVSSLSVPPSYENGTYICAEMLCGFQGNNFCSEVNIKLMHYIAKLRLTKYQQYSDWSNPEDRLDSLCIFEDLLKFPPSFCPL